MAIQQQSSARQAMQGQQQQANPFARALQEAEHSTQMDKTANSLDNPFSQALAQSGGSLANTDTTPAFNSMEQQQQLAAMEKQKKKDALRKKLHDQVNSVSEQQSVFDAREKQVKKQIEDLRDELKMLSKEVTDFNKQVMITTSTEIVDPKDGKYYINFFQQLRTFIMMLRQKIKSTKTWATQMHSKKKKKKGNKKPGLEVGGQKHEQTSTVFDMMHNEKGSTYTGG